MVIKPSNLFDCVLLDCRFLLKKRLVDAIAIYNGSGNLFGLEDEMGLNYEILLKKTTKKTDGSRNLKASHLTRWPLIIEALENKFEKQDNSMPDRFLIGISPAGFQFLQVALEEELLIMKLLLLLAPQAAAA